MDAPRCGRPPTREGLAERSLTGAPRRDRRGATSCGRSRPPGPFEAAGLTMAVERRATRAVLEGAPEESICLVLTRGDRLPPRAGCTNELRELPADRVGRR